MILSKHTSKAVCHTSPSLDLSTWIALNNIMLTEYGYETIVSIVQYSRKQQNKKRLRTMTLHCHDVRIIKLIFNVDEDKTLSPIICAIPDKSQEISLKTSIDNMVSYCLLLFCCCGVSNCTKLHKTTD